MTPGTPDGPYRHHFALHEQSTSGWAAVGSRAQPWDACMGGLIAASGELVKVGLSVKSLPPRSH